MHHFFHPPFLFALHVVGVLILLSIAAKVVGRRGCAAACGGRGSRAASSSSEPVNREFDAYRQATLKRLELEAEEFRKYLDGLRAAADKAAFDTFLTSRRGGSVT